MKKIIFALALSGSFFTSAVHAEDANCPQLSQLAGMFMKGRQEGVTMARAMEIAGNNKVMQLMVEQAYSQSRYSTEEFKQRKIQEFSNEWFMTCYKARKKS